MITRKRLLELLSYDEKTGQFFWLVSQGTRRAGSVAGNNRPDGYVYINLDKVLYRRSRLVWLYVHRRWPNGEMDHINGNPNDVKLEELQKDSVDYKLLNQFASSDRRYGAFIFEKR